MRIPELLLRWNFSQLNYLAHQFLTIPFRISCIIPTVLQKDCKTKFNLTVKTNLSKKKILKECDSSKKDLIVKSATDASPFTEGECSKEDHQKLDEDLKKAKNTIESKNNKVAGLQKKLSRSKCTS